MVGGTSGKVRRATAEKKQEASLTSIESFTVYKALRDVNFTVYKALEEMLTHLTCPIILWRRTLSTGLPGLVFFPLHNIIKTD